MKKNKIKEIPSVDYIEWKSKYGIKPSKRKMKNSAVVRRKKINSK